MKYINFIAAFFYPRNLNLNFKVTQNREITTPLQEAFG